MTPEPRLRARAPPPREPVFNVPLVVVLLVGGLLAAHGVRLWLDEETQVRLFAELAFVPGRIALLFDAEGVAERLAALAAEGPEGAREAMVQRYFLGDGSVKPWTVLSYALLHGNWPHVLLNGLWLLAFGSAIARRFGSLRFLALMAATAAAGAVLHFVTHPTGLTPIVGASAAVSGAMGAAARFVFQRGAPLSALGQALGDVAYRLPALTLGETLRDRRAVLFLGVWFVLNFAFGASAMTLGVTDAPIAWEAHIGGLVAGLLLFGPLDPRP